MRPTVRHLEYSVAVAEQGSFREAAKTCHVTQPALSSQIAQFEEIIGVRIFERSRKGVLLTTAGREIIHRARRVLAGLDDLAGAANSLAEPLSTVLRLGVIPTIAPYVLPTLLPKVRRDYPKLRTLLKEDQTEVLVALANKGELDVLLLAQEAELGDLDVQPPARATGRRVHLY